MIGGLNIFSISELFLKVCTIPFIKSLVINIANIIAIDIRKNNFSIYSTFRIINNIDNNA
jgi:hypothetical protein